MSSPSSDDIWWGPRVVILAVLIVGVGWWCGRPPAPVSDSAAATEFSSARAMEYMWEIARAPHPTGSAEHARVRDYIVTQLERLGVHTELHETTALLRADTSVRSVAVQNIVGRLPGTASSGAVVLLTHYDSEIHTPAAGDISAGVAAIIEAVRAIQAGPPLENDLLVVITDAEELGLVGAQAFVEEHPWMEDVALVLNFEGRGGSGPATMFETGPDNGWVVAQYANVDPYPMGNSLGYEVYKYLPNDTDFSRFREMGVAGLNFAYIEGADRYHRSTDTVENLSEASLQHHGEHAVAMARQFGNLDLSQTGAPDVAFFRFPGLGMVVYPLSWVLTMNAAVLALFLGIAIWGVRRRGVRILGLLAGFVIFLIASVLAGGYAWLVARWVVLWHPEYGSLVGTVLYDEHLYMLAVMALTVAAVASLYGAARRWFRPGELALGGALVPLLGAITTALWWPGANALYLWPLALALVGIAYVLRWTEDHQPRWVDVLFLLACAVPTLVFLADIAWMLAIAMSILIAPLIAVIVVQYLSLLFPLLELTGRPNRQWLPNLGLLLSTALILIGVLAAGSDPAHPGPSTLAYVVDRDLGSAYWITTQRDNDGWVEQFVGEEVAMEEIDHLIPGAQRRYRVANAPLDEGNLVGATVDVLDDRVEAGSRVVAVTIRSPVAAEKIQIRPVYPESTSLVAVNGRPISSARNFGESDEPLSGEWSLEHWGAADGGIVLDLTATSPSEPIELLILETVHALPRVISSRDLSRPPHLAPNVLSLTDQTIYRQAVVF